MEIYAVLPLEERDDFLACCDLNDVSVYMDFEQAEYAAYKLNKGRAKNARYKWQAIELTLDGFKGAA